MRCLFLSYGYYIVVVVQLLSSVWLFTTPWTAAQQAPLSSTISLSLLKFMSIESIMLFNHLTSATPFSFCLQSFPTSGSFPMSRLLAAGGQLWELQLQHQSFQWIFRDDFLWDWLVWSPCSPRDSQEYSPAPQFHGINTLVLSLLYGPALTSIHDQWKNHSFDYTDLCQKSDIFAF